MVAGCAAPPPAAAPAAGDGVPARCPDTPGASLARLIDLERARRDLPPLVLDARLSAAATAHARDLARRDATGHAGADGSGPAERAAAAGYVWRVIAENVAAGQPRPSTAVAAWMGSPGHRANILAPDVRHVGVGWARDPYGRLGWHWVVLFGDADAVTPLPGGCPP